jgi:hypothetical protein
MYSGKPPEFFFDRSLGKITAARLRNAGYVVHRIADHYPHDADDIPDQTWIAEGCSHGWALLTKDKRIRYRASELAALHTGHLFCLVSGNLTISEMSIVWLNAMPRMLRAIRDHQTGFWHVYRDGTIRQMWP